MEYRVVTRVNGGTFVFEGVIQFVVNIFAAIFKHQGYEVKELPDADEDDHQVIDLSGKLKVFAKKTCCILK